MVFRMYSVYLGASEFSSFVPSKFESGSRFAAVEVTVSNLWEMLFQGFPNESTHQVLKINYTLTLQLSLENRAIEIDYRNAGAELTFWKACVIIIWSRIQKLRGVIFRAFALVVKCSLFKLNAITRGKICRCAGESGLRIPKTNGSGNFPRRSHSGCRMSENVAMVYGRCFITIVAYIKGFVKATYMANADMAFEMILQKRRCN